MAHQEGPAKVPVAAAVEPDPAPQWAILRLECLRQITIAMRTIVVAAPIGPHPICLPPITPQEIIIRTTGAIETIILEAEVITTLIDPLHHHRGLDTSVAAR